MKEILYLDNNLVNSFLAQENSGLIAKFVTSLQTNLTESETNGNSLGVNANVSVPLVSEISANGNTNNNSSTSYSKVNLELQEHALHDYALDLLLARIETDKQTFEDGKIVKVNDSIKVFDFSKLEVIMDKKLITLFDKNYQENMEIDEQIKEIQNKPSYKGNKQLYAQQIKDLKSTKHDEEINYENFNHARKIGIMGNALFPESCLIKVANLISICPKENLRINDATLSLYSETTRKFHCLGIVIYQRGDGHIKESEDGTIDQLSPETIAASSQTMIMDILLDSFNLSAKGDYIIRPIAIYFE